MGKKYIIDVDEGTCVPYVEQNSKSSLSEEIAKYRGDKEYTGVVEKIQKWYYGSLVKASWCATGISYFMDSLGRLDEIGGKNENVYHMLTACLKSEYGRLYEKCEIPPEIKKDDILFFLWSGETMDTTSSKHVGVAEYDSTGDTVFCIGCNQKDKICTLEYPRDKIYAIFRPL